MKLHCFLHKPILLNNENREHALFTCVFTYSCILTGVGYSDRERNIGIQAPPLTKLVKSILQRYPEGGQILKVLYFCILPYRKIRLLSACAYNFWRKLFVKIILSVRRIRLINNYGECIYVVIE